MSGIVKDDNREEFWIFCFLLQRKGTRIDTTCKNHHRKRRGTNRTRAHLPIRGDNCFFGFYCLPL
jgi:hypothetical protein